MWMFSILSQNARKKITFEKPDLEMRILEKKNRAKCHPSKYWLGSTLLNFSDRTRTGVFSVTWPLATLIAKVEVLTSKTFHYENQGRASRVTELSSTQNDWTLVHLECRTLVYHRTLDYQGGTELSSTYELSSTSHCKKLLNSRLPNNWTLVY